MESEIGVTVFVWTMGSVMMWGAGCGSGKAPAPDTGDEVKVACEASCEDEIPPWPMNVVGLATNSVEQTGAFNDCDPTDSVDDDGEWPCIFPLGLEEKFVDVDGFAIEAVVDRPNTEIRFTYGAHTDWDELYPHSGNDCADLIYHADQKGSYTTFESWIAALKTAALGCTDTDIVNHAMANVWLVDNRWNNYSFVGWTNTLSTCSPSIFIHESRLPDGSAGDYDFKAAANEHEMGHAFGLGHTCHRPIRDSSTQPSNIMQTTSGNCCCECAWKVQAKEDPDTGTELVLVHDTGDLWRDECNNCSEADTGVGGYTPPAGCGTDPGDSDWDDCQDFSDNPEFSVGSRAVGFDGVTRSGIDGESTASQLEVIRTVALDRCACDCVAKSTSSQARTMVKTELNCTSGTGTFALIAHRKTDADDDGTGWMQLAPVLIDGDHLGPLGWITDVDFTSLGDFDEIVAPTQGNPLVFTSSDPDELDTTDVEVFKTGQTTATYTMGELATGYPWAVDGVSMTMSSYEWPVVDLEWDCNSDYGAADVYRQRRPPNAYNLPSTHLSGDWDQDLHLRPDLVDLRMWVEVRGSPRHAKTVDLVDIGGGKYTWDLDAIGFTASGWIKRVGQPTGAKLRAFTPPPALEQPPGPTNSCQTC